MHHQCGTRSEKGQGGGIACTEIFLHPEWVISRESWKVLKVFHLPLTNVLTCFCPIKLWRWCRLWSTLTPYSCGIRCCDKGGGDRMPERSPLTVSSLLSLLFYYRYYVKARAVLIQYQHMPSFYGIEKDCNEIVNELRIKLKEQFRDREVGLGVPKQLHIIFDPFFAPWSTHPLMGKLSYFLMLFCQVTLLMYLSHLPNDDTLIIQILCIDKNAIWN